jgi:hypothetical protein
MIYNRFRSYCISKKAYVVTDISNVSKDKTVMVITGFSVFVIILGLQ